MKQAGLQCRVLNVQPRAPVSEAYIKISGAADLLRELFWHAANDWSLSVHTNGHNVKSWLIAFVCGFAAQVGPGATLTVHSGMAPAYLQGGWRWRRTVARMSCLLYDRVVCVNEEIAEAIVSLGIPKHHLEVKPAYVQVEPAPASIPEGLEKWMAERAPLISMTLSFRREYGFELLVKAIAVLRRRHPKLGCVVMGGGEDREEARRLLERQEMTEAVLLAGDLAHDLCLAVIARSSVFVRPTLADGDSTSVREAAALGIPVVASNVGRRPEGALLFEAGDRDGLVGQVEHVLALGNP